MIKKNLVVDKTEVSQKFVFNYFFNLKMGDILKIV